MTGAMLPWLDRHARACVLGLAIAAVALRAILVAFSPWSFGYVWDLYHEVLQHLYLSGRLPAASHKLRQKPPRRQIADGNT